MKLLLILIFLGFTLTCKTAYCVNTCRTFLGGPILEEKPEVIKNAINSFVTANGRNEKLMSALNTTGKFNGRLGSLSHDISVVFHGDYKLIESQMAAYDSSAVDVFNLRTARGIYQLLILESRDTTFSVALIIFNDWIFPLSEYKTGTRLDESFAVKLDSKGRMLDKKLKSDYLLDSYPSSEVVLTRTMSFAEENLWKNPSTNGQQLGSMDMKRQAATEYLHLCFASGGYFNDVLENWDVEVEFVVPKRKLKLWIQQQRAYITPIGLSFFVGDHISAQLADVNVTLPFEFVSTDPGVNQDILGYYRSSQNDDRLLPYRKVSRPHSDLKRKNLENNSTLF